MPLILAAVVALAGFIWWAWARERAARGVSNKLDQVFRKRPECRWTATGEGSANLKQYKCETCAVTAYSSGGKPPRDCKRKLSGAL